MDYCVKRGGVASLMDSVNIVVYGGSIFLIVTVIAVFALTWDYGMAQLNDGYYIAENNTDYKQIIVYDDRGDAKVQSLLHEGWSMVGVTGNEFTLVRSNQTND
jgi:hypothetical protein